MRLALCSCWRIAGHLHRLQASPCGCPGCAEWRGTLGSTGAGRTFWLHPWTGEDSLSCAFEPHRVTGNTARGACPRRRAPRLPRERSGGEEGQGSRWAWKAGSLPHGLQEGVVGPGGDLWGQKAGGQSEARGRGGCAEGSDVLGRKASVGRQGGCGWTWSGAQVPEASVNPAPGLMGVLLWRAMGGGQGGPPCSRSQEITSWRRGGACVLSDYSSWFWTCTTQAPVLAAPISQMGEVRPHGTGVE